MAFCVSIDGNAASTMRGEIREGGKSAARVVGETALCRSYRSVLAEETISGCSHDAPLIMGDRCVLMSGVALATAWRRQEALLRQL